MASKDVTTQLKNKNKQHQRHSPYSYTQKHCRLQSSSSSSSPKSKEHSQYGANEETQKTINPPDFEVYKCISARQPYAGFILDGIKTIETRWEPIFKNMEGSTVAIRVAWKDWDGGEWRRFLRKDRSEEEIEELVTAGERHGRGVVTGLIDVGKTWQFSAPESSDEEITTWENRALLRPLDEKFLTEISNPRWLIKPWECNAQGKVWEVAIPNSYLP